MKEQFILFSKFFDQTINAFQKFEEVDSIVLGGSRSVNSNDENSDYDVYIYLNSWLDESKRRIILETTCSYLEINNTYWECEDDCILNDGVRLEIIYRNLIDTDNSLSGTLLNHQANCGYSTCLCYNVFNAKILYDPQEKYRNLVKKYSFPYPQELKRNIIFRNRNLLDGKIPSYSNQIEKALKRNDFVSVNHRLTEFLASYFDIIFALNELYHPGEKRLIELCLKHCRILPNNFENNLVGLTNRDSKTDILQTIKEIVKNIDVLIEEINLTK